MQLSTELFSVSQVSMGLARTEIFAALRLQLVTGIFLVPHFLPILVTTAASQRYASKALCFLRLPVEGLSQGFKGSGVRADAASILRDLTDATRRLAPDSLTSMIHRFQGSGVKAAAASFLHGLTDAICRLLWSVADLFDISKA